MIICGHDLTISIAMSGGYRSRSASRGRGGSTGRFRGGDRPHRGPRLPESLRGNLASKPGPSTVPVSRKEARKAKRRAKAESRLSHFQSRHKKADHQAPSESEDASDSSLSIDSIGKKRKGRHGSAGEKGNGSKSAETSASNAAKRRRIYDEYNSDSSDDLSDIEDDMAEDYDPSDSDMSSRDIRRRKRIAAARAAALASIGPTSAEANLNEDDKLIRTLEKRLGIKQRTKKDGSGSGTESAASMSGSGSESDGPMPEAGGGDGSDSGSAGSKRKKAKRGSREDSVRQLNRYFEKEGFGSDFGDFLEDLDRIIYDEDEKSSEEYKRLLEERKRQERLEKRAKGDQIDSEEEEGDYDELIGDGDDLVEGDFDDELDEEEGDEELDDGALVEDDEDDDDDESIPELVPKRGSSKSVSTKLKDQEDEEDPYSDLGSDEMEELTEDSFDPIVASKTDTDSESDDGMTDEYGNEFPFGDEDESEEEEDDSDSDYEGWMETNLGLQPPDKRPEKPISLPVFTKKYKDFIENTFTMAHLHRYAVLKELKKRSMLIAEEPLSVTTGVSAYIFDEHARSKAHDIDKEMKKVRETVPPITPKEIAPKIVDENGKPLKPLLKRGNRKGKRRNITIVLPDDHVSSSENDESEVDSEEDDSAERETMEDNSEEGSGEEGSDDEVDEEEMDFDTDGLTEEELAELRMLTEEEGRQSAQLRPKNHGGEEDDDIDATDSEVSTSSDVGSDSESDAESKADPAPFAPGKYVPPHLRAKQAAAEAASKEAGSKKGASAASETKLKFTAPPGSPAPLVEVYASYHPNRIAAFSKGVPQPPEASSPEYASYLALRRRVQGVLNRLTDANLEAMTQEVAGWYREHGSSTLTTLLLQQMLSGLANRPIVLPALVRTYAAFVSALHIEIGPSVGVTFMERLALVLAEQSQLSLLANPSPEQLTAAKQVLYPPEDADANVFPSASGLRLPRITSRTKFASNVALLLAYLFLFDTATSTLLGHLCLALSTRFTESDVELLLLILTHAGFGLRTADAVLMRDVLKLVHGRLKGTEALRIASQNQGAFEKQLEQSFRLDQDANALSANEAQAGKKRMLVNPTTFEEGDLSSLVSKFKQSKSDNGDSNSTTGTTSTVSDANATEDEDGSMRMVYLSEMILDLRNNRKRPVLDALLEKTKPLRTWLNRLASKQTQLAAGADRRLRFGWTDVLAIPEMGRWWVVGANWAGNRAAGASSLAAQAVALGTLRAGSDAAKSPVASSGGIFGDVVRPTPGAPLTGPLNATATDAAAANVDVDSLDVETTLAAGKDSEKTALLLELARKMQMNTPTRRAIFVALLSAEDVPSALDNLLRLRLRGPAEREIVRVLIDCAAQESPYNIYYAAVARQLAVLHPRFRFTCQLALWDAWKAWGETQDADGEIVPGDPRLTTPRRVYNISLFTADLLEGKTVTLTILKPMNFINPGRWTLLFLKSLCSAIFTKTPMSQIPSLFSRLGNGPDQITLRDGLMIFFHQYVSASAIAKAAKAKGAAEMDKADVAALSEKIKAAKKALENAVKGSDLGDDAMFRD